MDTNWTVEVLKVEAAKPYWERDANPIIPVVLPDGTTDMATLCGDGLTSWGCYVYLPHKQSKTMLVTHHSYKQMASTLNERYGRVYLSDTERDF